ncbi:hypothetical protein ACSBR1_017679 [Camellia fascicularis]
MLPLDPRLKQSYLVGSWNQTKQSRKQSILSYISISIWQRNLQIAKAQNNLLLFSFNFSYSFLSKDKNMAEMMIAGSLLSASFKVLFERLACPLFLKFFKSLTRHNEGDKLLKKLKSKLLRLTVILNDAEKQQFTNQLVKDWMDELKDAIYHADDLLDEIATKALGCKVEAEYRSAVKNQVTTSTLTSDSIHDLAQVVHGQFSFRVDDKKLLDISPKARHFSYKRRIFGDFENFKAINEAKYLRSILPFPFEYPRTNFPKKVLDDIFPTQRCLRLLSLPRCNIMDLPYSIGNLIHLRYLDLSNARIKKLPEVVCTVYNLQTLLLSNCYLLTTLPMEIGKLILLRHLDISGSKLIEMPMQMCRLKGLQHLTNFVVGKCSGSGIDELKEFHHLRAKLTISGLQNVRSGRDALEAKLKKKEHLEEIVLGWGNTTENSQNEREVLENLQPHTNLKRLTITRYGGTRFPEWLGDHSYSNIVSLFLYECDHCFSLPPLGQLSSLKHLHIARMNGITKVGGEFYGDGFSTKPFQSLETLRFEAMLEWVEWYILGVEEFSQLKELCVIECPKLVGGLPKQMPSWVRLEIRECSALTASLPRTSVANELVLNGCNGVDLGWQGVSFPEGMHSSFPSLEELIIWNCPEIESFPEGSNLRRLQIWNCEKLVACRREWGLQRLPSLTDFTFGGGNYEEEDDVLESFLEEGLLPPTLTSLGISNLQNLKSINYQSFQHLTCLKVLRICNCPQLQSLPEEGFLPSLYRLEIKKCPLLKRRCERDRGDEWHKIAHIPFIKIDGDEWHKIARTSVKSSSANCSTLPKHQTSQLS